MQYKDMEGATNFESIYKIRCQTTEITDLLMLQSIYYCDSLYQIESLVEMQGDPNIFYSSYLELDRRNLVSILAFDSRAIRELLQDRYAEYFDDDHPIFYANKHPIS